MKDKIVFLEIVRHSYFANQLDDKHLKDWAGQHCDLGFRSETPGRSHLLSCRDYYHHDGDGDHDDCDDDGGEDEDYHCNSSRHPKPSIIAKPIASHSYQF